MDQLQQDLTDGGASERRAADRSVLAACFGVGILGVVILLAVLAHSGGGAS